MIRLAVIFSLIVVSQAIQLKFWDCGRPRSEKIFKSIVLLNCRQQPCTFNSQNDLDFEIQVMLDETVTNFNIQFDGRYYEYGVARELATYTLQPPNCRKGRCKIRAHDIRCMHPSWKIGEKITDTLDVNVNLYDQDHVKLGCASFALQVKGY